MTTIISTIHIPDKNRIVLRTDLFQSIIYLLLPAKYCSFSTLPLSLAFLDSQRSQLVMRRSAPSAANCLFLRFRAANTGQVYSRRLEWLNYSLSPNKLSFVFVFSGYVVIDTHYSFLCYQSYANCFDAYYTLFPCILRLSYCLRWRQAKSGNFFCVSNLIESSFSTRFVREAYEKCTLVSGSVRLLAV